MCLFDYKSVIPAQAGIQTPYQWEVLSVSLDARQKHSGMTMRREIINSEIALVKEA
jgi:hypothetical protein